MKRFTSSFGVTLLAFLLSGGGNVLASALCPHAMGGSQPSFATAEPSCHSSSQTAGPTASAPDHHSRHETKMTPASSSEPRHSDVAFDQSRGTCTDCCGPKESSTTLISAHGLILKKQDPGAVADKPIVLAVEFTAGFTPQSIPTQHGPPGSSNRKHLLLSVFLI